MNGMKNAFFVYLSNKRLLNFKSHHRAMAYVFRVCTFMRSIYGRTLPQSCAPISRTPAQTHTNTHTNIDPRRLVLVAVVARVSVCRVYAGLCVRDEYEQRNIRHSFGYETIRSRRLNRTHEVSEKESAAGSSS